MTFTHDGAANCTLEGHPRSVTVILAAPLGGRVLLDENGDPLVVCQQGRGC